MSVTLPEWVFGADMGLPGYTTVTNLVRVPPPPPTFPPSIPRLKFHARPPGSSSVRHCSGHKDLQRMLLVNTAEPPPSACSPVSPQRYVKYVVLLWQTWHESSQPPHWSVSQWWRYYSGYVTHVRLLSTQRINCYQQVMKAFTMDLWWAFSQRYYFPFLNW